MVAYLSVQSGSDKGKHFALDPDRPMHIGRGANCEIILSDPVSSRFHAVIYFEDGNWHLRDTSSRNGTFINGQKAMHARMQDRSTLRIGSTELQLVEPKIDTSIEDESSRTVMHDMAMNIVEEKDSIDQLTDPEHLIDLYLLSLSLLRHDHADDVAETTLQLLRGKTGADVIALTFDSGDGKQKPRKVFPLEEANNVQLDRLVLKSVVGNCKAIWINDTSGLSDNEDSKIVKRAQKNWSDAIYVPLEEADKSLGVLHLYRSEPAFEEKHFELAVAAGRLLAVGLARGMEHDSMRAKSQRLAGQSADTDELIGESPVMQNLKERIARVGQANGSVLIRGESGSGKELVARAVHRSSKRSAQPMLTVNCAAIPAELIESQLFGHKKGAFTGADKDHVGWFQQAHTGTLFLDEIGELTLEGQAKLLRILEGHPFLPVGASEEVLVDVRVIAATNRDLAEFVREKKFREDLFYRLSVFELFVPPLRDRGSDIERLTNHFLEHFRRQHGRPALQLTPDALNRMLEYQWPGNVRQLRNVIDSAVVMTDGPIIEADELGLRDAGISRLDTLRIDEWEKRLISKALKRTNGNVPEAAKLLGVSRATAYRKISDYNIQR